MKSIVRLGSMGGLLLSLLIGCDSPDGRLVELSERSAERQAEQNAQMARQSQEVATASRALVEADAKARAELLATQQKLQQGLQAERSHLNHQHEDLASQRQELVADQQELVSDRHQLVETIQREPVIAQTLLTTAVIIGSLLPLVLGFKILHALGPEDHEQGLADLLVLELVDEQSPLLLAQQRALPALGALEQDLPQLPDESAA